MTLVRQVACWAKSPVRGKAGCPRGHIRPSSTSSDERSPTSPRHRPRAASLLKTAGLNFRIVELKAGYLNAAVWWFKIALALRLILALLLTPYAATAPVPGGEIVCEALSLFDL